MSTTALPLAGHPTVPTQPVDVVDLRPGDHVIVLGTPVEILGIRGHRAFPSACRLRMRPLPAGNPVETLLPALTVLTGLHLPRRRLLRCTRCTTNLPTVVDLVLGQPPQIRCTGCAPVELGDTAALPIQQHRHREA